MKRILYFFLCLPLLHFSQKKDCIFDFEEKTDSTYIKATNGKLMYEKVFGNSKEFIQFKLINNNGIPTLEFQQIQKSQDFIPVRCFNNKSKVILQLEDGKIISLISAVEDVCSNLTYIDSEKSNIRILNAYFLFTKPNYESLKKSRITVMRVHYTGESKDYIISDELQSEILNERVKPSLYFIENLECIE